MASFLGGSLPLAAVTSTAQSSQGTQSGLVNVALSQVLGNNISQQSGLNLTNGQNVQQSQLTSLISPALSGQMTDLTQNTLGSVGSLSSVLPVVSQFSTGFGGGSDGLLGAAGGLLGGFGGGGGAASAIGNVASRIWAGGGGNGPSDYGGFMHNLGPNGSDVVFSIVPANSGPQSSGLKEAVSSPTVATTLPANVFTTAPPQKASPAFTELSKTKLFVMTGS